MKLSDAQESVLHLVANYLEHGCRAVDIEERVRSLPTDVAIVVLRIHSAEILLSFRLCGEHPPEGLLLEILRACTNIREHPFMGTAGKAADFATAELLCGYGVRGVSPEETPRLGAAGGHWALVGEELAAFSSLAYPGSFLSSCQDFEHNALSLSRAACLATAKGQLLAASRMYRWQPFLRKTSAEPLLRELGIFLKHSSRRQATIRVNLAIAHALMQ